MIDFCPPPQTSRVGAPRLENLVSVMQSLLVIVIVGGMFVSLITSLFYTNRTGYKMCVRIYLNGKGTHVSLHISSSLW